MPDIIFVSMEDWDEVWRRNQFLVSGFSRVFPQNQVLFVGLPRNLSRALGTLHFDRISGAGLQQAGDHANVHVLKPWKPLPDSLPGCRGMNERVFRANVRSAARQLGLCRPVLWLNPHYACHMVGRMNESRTIYDITDDWIELTQSPACRERTRKQDATLCRLADHVIVCSRKLLEDKRHLAKRVRLVPNGVDHTHYRCVLEGSGPLPAVFDALPRPVLGYTGTIHRDRVDIPLVASLAPRFRGTILLLGTNMLDPTDRRRLQETGKVHFAGAVPYAQIPQYMRGFDVCIAPHRVTAFTESLNPIKLWEYLAAGKPIVSTPVAGFRDYPELVHLASGPDAFLDAVAAALIEPPFVAEARRTEAARHSWSSRINDILPLLDASHAQGQSCEDSLHAA